MANNKITDWEDVPVESQKIDDWEDVPEGPSELESAGRGAIQGASFGLRDEAAGALKSPMGALKAIANKFGGEFSDEDLEEYKRERDESRQLDKQASEANPKSYMAGQVGGALATSVVPGLGGAGVAKLAAQGAAQGLGNSEAEDLAGNVRDTAIGAGIGAATGAAGKLLNKAGSVGKEVLEDVATAPIGQKAAESAMGNTSAGLSKLNRAGQFVNDKIDDAVSAILPKTGDKTADAIIKGGAKLATKGSYLVPGLNKVQAAADAAQFGPKIAQKASELAVKSIDTIIPRMGKFSAVLASAAQRGSSSLASTDYVLQQTNPEYREQRKLATGNETDEQENE